MREKLIELSKQLRYCANVSDCETCKRLDKVCEQKCVDNLLLEAAELLESAANGVVVSKMETTTKWIPVTERLPEESGLCLVYTARGIVMEMDYSAKYKLFNMYDNGIGSPIACSHWMPLPEPPKGE